MLIADALAAEQRTVVAHSASYGSVSPQISKAPAGAAENHNLTTYFFRPIRGLNRFANSFPRLSPWATISHHSVAETQITLQLILWRTRSPIC
jgi:hypothetical protein